MVSPLRAHWLDLALLSNVVMVATAEDGSLELSGWLALDLFLFWCVARGARWAYAWLFGLQLATVAVAGFGLVGSQLSEQISTNATWWTLLVAVASAVFLFLHNRDDEHEAVREARAEVPIARG